MPRSSILLILGVALLVRLALILALGRDSSSLLASAHDEHAQIARNLAEGRGFRFNFFGSIESPDLTSQQAPVVPYAIAACYLMFGVESFAAFLAMVGIQSLLTTIAALLLAMAVFERSQNRSVAIASGLIAALYPPFALSSLHIQALPWNLYWVALLLWGSAKLRAGIREPVNQNRTSACAFIAGAVGGILTDPILAAVVGVLLIWIAWPSGRHALQWGRPAMLGFAILIGLAPWIARNFEVHGRLVLVKDSFWYVFWQGNTIKSQGTDKLLVAQHDIEKLNSLGTSDLLSGANTIRKKSVSINDASLTSKDLEELAALPSEIARMNWFGNRIRTELSNNPAHYFEMCRKRLFMWFWFDETNPKSFLWPYRAVYLGLFGLAIAGILLCPDRRWVTPFALVWSTLMLVHVGIITSARFRVLAELLLVPASAFTAMCVLERFAGFAGEVRRTIKPALST